MKKQIILSILLILITVGLIYSNSLNGYWHFDDEINIALNGRIYMTEFNWHTVKNSFFAGGARGIIYHPILYRPVVMFSFAVNFLFGKNISFGYHVVNVVIHLLASLFLFLFIRETLLLPKLKEAYGKYAIAISLVATLLWATNPVQLQAVSYIVQRMASMAGMFFILSMWLYVKFRTSRHKLYIIGSVIAGLLAVGSKENAITLPFCILLYDLFFIQGISRQSIKKTAFIVIGFLGVSFLITLALSGWETFSFEKITAGYVKRDFTLIERVITQPRVFFFYLSLLFYSMPWRLCLVHGFDVSRGLLYPWTTILSIVMFFEIIAFCIWQSKKYPLVTFSILFFFINHLIEGSIFPLELVYEHRNYLPSMLLFVPVAILMVKAWQWTGNVSLRYAVTGCVAILIFSQGITTYGQNKVWETEESLWLHNISVSPTRRAFFNLGTSYYKQGDWVNMKKYWTKVTTYNDDYNKDDNISSAKIIPSGKVHSRAFDNLRILGFMDKLGGKEALRSFSKHRKRRGQTNRIVGWDYNS